MIRYWFKILYCEYTKYINLIYKMMLEDKQNSPEKPSLAKSVKYLLESLGFGQVWLSQGVGDLKVFFFSSCFQTKVKR